MRPSHFNRGFTLIEILVSTAIIALLVLILASSLGQASGLLRYTSAKVEQFREARTGFEAMTTRLSQATLNTYWDYDNPKLPTRYERRSDLRFTCGPADKLLGTAGTTVRLTHCIFFHAPLGASSSPQSASDPGYHGLENLLNVTGYFVQYSDDSTLRPPFLTTKVLPARWRFRLMEFGVPTEEVRTYNFTSGTSDTSAQFPPPKAASYMDTSWFTGPLQDSISGGTKTHAGAHVLAENVIALIITPRLAKNDELALKGGVQSDLSPLAPNYAYDSSPVPPATLNSDPRYADPRTNPISQLPPVVQITMVAIDESSAARRNFGAGSANVFNVSGKFANTKNYSADLLTDPVKPTGLSLEETLIAQKVSYRIFTSNVPIRAAKWSRQQSK